MAIYLYLYLKQKHSIWHPNIRGERRAITKILKGSKQQLRGKKFEMFPPGMTGSLGSLRLWAWMGTQRLRQTHEATEGDEARDRVILELQQKNPCCSSNQAMAFESELDLPVPDQELGIEGKRPMASNRHIKTRKGKVMSGKGDQGALVRSSRGAASTHAFYPNLQLWKDKANWKKMHSK